MKIDATLLDAIDELAEAVRAYNREKILAPVVRKYEPQIAAVFRAQGKIVEAELKRKPSILSEAVSVNAERLEQILDRMEAETSKDMRQSLRVLDGQAYGAGIEAGSEVGRAISFSVKHPAAVEWLESHAAEMVTNINETTRSTIADIVTRGVEDGTSYDKIARSIKDRFEDFAEGRPQQHIQSRAHLVAVTESGNAYERGKRDGLETMRKLGIELEKSWNTMGDGAVSDGCKENEDAGWIPFDDSFPSGDTEPLRFPGCRCNCTYRVVGSDTEEEM